LGLRSYEHNSFPGPRMRTGPFGSRRAETIGTNHGVLDISTIDTPGGPVQTACFPSEVIEHFANEQPPTALTEHRSSFCFLCHPYVMLTRRPSSGSDKAAPSSAMAYVGRPLIPERRRLWTGVCQGTEMQSGQNCSGLIIKFEDMQQPGRNVWERFHQRASVRKDKQRTSLQQGRPPSSEKDYVYRTRW
jgi:hypothetical protein